MEGDEAAEQEDADGAKSAGPHLLIIENTFSAKTAEGGATTRQNQCCSKQQNAHSIGAEARRATPEIITALQLEKFWPNKISFSDIGRVSSSESSENKNQSNLALDKLPWVVLKGIIGFDRTARDKSCRTDASDADEDPFCNKEDTESSSPHPMDVLQACFLCCDPELQQILCKALFACKLAFPLIYTSCQGRLTLSQWSLRDIVVEYQDSLGELVETSLVSDHPFPAVCFARIGEIGASKSKLLNSLLSRNSLDTYFHRDCNGGDLRREITNGLVEGSVFLPPESQSADNLTFRKPFLVGNLRGDLMEHRDQFKAIVDIFDIVVLLVDISKLQSPDDRQVIDKLQACHKKTILIIYNKEHRKVNKSANFESLKGKVDIVLTFTPNSAKNEYQILSVVSNKLGAILDETLGEKREELASGMHMDEQDLLLSESKDAGIKVVSHVTKSDIHTFKAEHLPLQGIWMQISQLHKQENSSKTDKTELENIQSMKAEKRLAQLDCCKTLSPFLRDFMKNIRFGRFKADQGLPTKLLLQWEKLLLDQMSRRNLPELHKERNKLRNEFQNLSKLNSSKEHKESAQIIQSLSKSIGEIERKILDVSIGLENVFREVAQYFEATSSFQKEHALQDESKPMISVKKTLQNSTSMPEVFARLLLMGIPLEILDGDASNIPLTWVTSVLSHCQQIVGPKKIFAVSVLGLQSSGKSTLLNTMFGLKFAVSAGRCTRGAFLQLVPVEPGRPFDFVAVIDTEGLRAPELGLDKHHHDNELASLVVGLGDVTVINLKGENTAEMKDILQIVVHAFIKMKMANGMRDLRRKCIFIHQNVSAVGAKERMKDANFRIQQDLDSMTREAADEEKLTSVQSFSDIISFDSGKDIFYMSDYWLGDPPMAPVNPGYSVKVREIRSHILYSLDAEHKSFCGFDDFSLRIKDLWTAIMSEDFVFSFRNTVEIKAYRLMESDFFEIKRQCEAKLNSWLTKNALIVVKKCSCKDEVTRVCESLTLDLNQHLHDCYDSGNQRLLKFFKDNPYREQTIQWKAGKTSSLSEHIKTLGSDTSQKIKELCNVQLLESQQKSMPSQWERNVLIEAKKAAEQLPVGCPADELNEKFEAFWTIFLDDLPLEETDHRDSVRTKVENFLKDCYPMDGTAVAKYFKMFFSDDAPFVSTIDKSCLLKHEDLSFLDEDSADLPSSHSHLTEQLLFGNDETSLFQVSRESSHDDLHNSHEKSVGITNKNATEELTAISNKILQQVKTEVAAIATSNRWFEEADAGRVHKVVATGLSTALIYYEGASITAVFEIKLVVIALRYAYPHFVAFDNRFRESCSIKAKTLLIKEQIRNSFSNMVQRQSTVKIAADYVKDHLITVIRKAVNQQLKGKVMSIIIQEIGCGKSHLIVRMLNDFADEEKFEELILYVKSSRSAALRWLDKFIPQFLTSKAAGSDDTRLASVITAELIGPMRDAVTRADEKACSEHSGTLKSWIACFCKNVECELAVRPQDLETVFTAEIRVEETVKLNEFIDFFRPALQQAIVKLEQSYKQSLDTHEIDTSPGEALSRLVLSSLWGCSALCPFCREPCCKDDATHYEKEKTPHTCLQHRPQAVVGVDLRETKELCFWSCNYSVSAEGMKFNHLFCRAYNVQTPSCASCGNDNSVYHLYKKYKRYFPDWDIKPDASNKSSKFWMWFCARFVDDLAIQYKRSVNELPKTWKKVSKKRALKSLRRCVSKNEKI